MPSSPMMHATLRAIRPAGAWIAVLLLLASCARLAGSSDAGAPGSTAPGSSLASASGRPLPSERPLHAAPASGAPVVGEVPDEVLDPILAAAAELSGVAAADIQVMQAEQVTWPDGSLGCPEPGQMYTQALVDGYQVVLDAGGEQLDYRVGAGGSFHLCENGLPRGG